MRVQDVLRRPMITEKSTELRSTASIVAFEVDRRANKIEIKRAVEAMFDRKVVAVRCVRMHGKMRRQRYHAGRKPDWKKAYVRLADGEKPIEFFEGV